MAKRTDVEWTKGRGKGVVPPEDRDPFKDPLETPPAWFTWLKARLEIDPPLWLPGDSLVGGGASGRMGQGVEFSLSSPIGGTNDVSVALITDPHSFVSVNSLVVPPGLAGFYRIVISVDSGGSL